MRLDFDTYAKPYRRFGNKPFIEPIYCHFRDFSENFMELFQGGERTSKTRAYK